MRIRRSHNCPSPLIERGIFRKTFLQAAFVRTPFIFLFLRKFLPHQTLEPVDNTFHAFFIEFETSYSCDFGGGETHFAIVKPENFPVARTAMSTQYAVNLPASAPEFKMI